MPAPDRAPEGWSAVADAYVEHMVPHFTRFAEDALARVGLQPGERLLDVAAGPGTLAIPAARRGADVLATDLAPAMVEALRVRAAALDVHVEVAKMDGQDLQVEPGSFDVACSCLGLMVFDDRAAGFRGMHRALRTGGRCAVVAWGPPAQNPWFSTLAGAVRKAKGSAPPSGPPPAFSLADPALLAREMGEAGFGDVRVEQVTHPWDLGTPETAWTVITSTNPVTPAMMARLDDATRDDVHRSVVRAFAERAVDGRVVLPSVTNIAVGIA